MQTKAIPENVAEKLRVKPSFVSVKGPSGVIWKIGLVKRGDTLFFKNGWKEFVQDHYLKENDKLVFKYIGNSGFEVLLFDGQSLCEKESSYFIKKCDHQVSENRCKRNRSLPDSSFETWVDTDESSHEIVSYGPKKPRNHTMQTQRSDGRNKSLANGSDTSSSQLQSYGREATEQEKAKAWRMANAALSEDCFAVVMQPSHVKVGFCMTIPVKWARVHLSPKNQSVELRLLGKTWEVTYIYKETGGKLGVGWRAFVQDNKIKLFDVCFFKLISAKEDNIIMNVKIFRAIEDVVPVPSTSEVLLVPTKGKRTARYQNIMTNHGADS